MSVLGQISGGWFCSLIMRVFIEGDVPILGMSLFGNSIVSFHVAVSPSVKGLVFLTSSRILCLLVVFDIHTCTCAIYCIDRCT